MSQRQGSTPGPLWPALREPASVPALLENGQSHQNWGLLGWRASALFCSLTHPWSHPLGLPVDQGFLGSHGLTLHLLHLACGGARSLGTVEGGGPRGRCPVTLWWLRDPLVPFIVSQLCSAPHKTFPRQLGILLGDGRKVCKYISSFHSGAWHPHETRGRERPWLQ